jgi:hypothetical protein
MVVPIENAPLESSIAALHAERREFLHECDAKSPSSEVFSNIKILKVETMCTLKGRVIQSPQRESNRIAVALDEMAPDMWVLPEEGFCNVVLGSDRLLFHPLVLGEFSNHREYERNVVSGGGTNWHCVEVIAPSLALWSVCVRFSAMSTCPKVPIVE